MNKGVYQTRDEYDTINVFFQKAISYLVHEISHNNDDITTSMETLSILFTRKNTFYKINMDMEMEELSSDTSLVHYNDDLSCYMVNNIRHFVDECHGLSILQNQVKNMGKESGGSIASLNMIWQFIPPIISTLSITYTEGTLQREQVIKC